MPIPDDHLAYLEDMRALAKDEQGRRVLVGLSYDETEELYDYLGDRSAGTSGPGSGDRYLELHDKHELARLAVVMAEIEARQHPGPRH